MSLHSYWITPAIRYILVGVVNTMIGLGLILTLMWIGVGPRIANAIGYLVGITVSFWLNRSWTFRPASRHARQAVIFFAVAGIAWSIQFGTLNLLLNQNVHPVFSQIIATGVYTTAGFIGNRIFTFGRQT